MQNLIETLNVNDHKYHFYSFKKAKEVGLGSIDKLPRTLKILLENTLRNFNDPNKSTSWKDAEEINNWVIDQKSNHTISFYPTRILLQDYTGVPAVVDLASMRETIKKMGGSAKQVNPVIPVDLVIDHSIQVDFFGDSKAYQKNVKMEYERNNERYKCLKWAQNSFENFRVVPPNAGIVHQINLEYFAKVIWSNEDNIVYPDTSVGSDSHTTMINGLSVLAWGVGGIEAEAAMLGRPISMIIPQVIGMKLKGVLREGITATDLVLNLTKKFRDFGVVDKFVEFFGNGVKNLSLTDRATLANMSPEYGSTCAYFPIDEKTLEYLKLTGRSQQRIDLIEAYAKEQGLWSYYDEPDAFYTDIIEFDLDEVEACIAGPNRPQEKINLNKVVETFNNIKDERIDKFFPVENEEFKLRNGDVVIAAITSCTNTSNPSVMISAGLVARNAVKRGLKINPWVKTSLAPGSKVVTDYLIDSGLQKDLDALGFNLVGYGCTTCIGNSGPLSKEIQKTIKENNLLTASVISGNRNFEGRVNPDVSENFLASPPLVVAYALAGSIKIDITKDAIGVDPEGAKVYLKDLWPKDSEINDIMNGFISSKMFHKRNEEITNGDQKWIDIIEPEGDTYNWDTSSTYIKETPLINNIENQPFTDFKIEEAKILMILGDAITTDHISPAGFIAHDSPAGVYLLKNFVQHKDFNSYGSRRGNHEVMTRGTFANPRISNEMLPGTFGGYTKHIPSARQMSVYDAAMEYKKDDIPLIIFGGKEYGSGSSRDWAAKGTKFLGVKAVVAESFERIHRSNLIGMGVMPFEFEKGVTRKSLKLEGNESVSIQLGMETKKLTSNAKFLMIVTRNDESKVICELKSRVDTDDELNYFKNGGILEYVLKSLVNENTNSI